MRRLVILLVFGVLLVAVPMTVLADPPSTDAQAIAALQQKVASLEARIATLQAQAQEYTFLREDTQRYRAHMETEMARYQDFLGHEMDRTMAGFEWIVSIGAALLVLAGAILAFMFGRSLKVVRQEVVERTTQEMDKIAHQCVSTVNGELDAFHRAVNVEANLQQARVLVTGASEGELYEEQQLLRNWGVKNVEERTFDPKKFAAYIQKHRPDVVVFCYRPLGEAKQDDRVHEVVKVLKNGGRPIPLLVYTFDATKQIRVEGNDMAALSQYRWVVFANFPATLVSHVHEFARSFAARSRSVS